MSDGLGLSDEMKALLTIQRHRESVASMLMMMGMELQNRARHHDLSKLQLDEFGGFVRISAAARIYPYGSPELKAVIGVEKCVELHQRRNPHHPEHHADVTAMGFLDIIEMVVDWWAASKVYGKTPLEESLEDLQERYSFTDEQWWLVQQVVAWIDD